MKGFTDLINKSYLKAEIDRVVNAHPDVKSLYVDFEVLQQTDLELSEEVQNHPEICMVLFERTLKAFYPPEHQNLKLHIRFNNLKANGNFRIPVRKLRAEHLGKLVAIDGLVRKSTQVKPRITEAVFQCARCMATIHESQDTNHLHHPLECYKDQGGCGKSSQSTRFILIDENVYFNEKRTIEVPKERSKFIDAQKLEIQEIPEGLNGGEQPEKLTAYCADDICQIAKPGDKVILTGILKSRQKGSDSNPSVTFETYLDVSSIETEKTDFAVMELTPEDELQIQELSKDPELFNKLRNSIAPSIFGHELEKEALVLQMFGGVSKNLPDGNRLRGEIHVLLIGEPGIAKSQLLRYISKLAPRGIYTSGKNSSAAGLTAAAVKDAEFGEGKWTLEAGALVLADKGHCCIDELNLMEEKDRSALNEAMEQQMISISKAGINATLQCRCAILAAANPANGRWDEHSYIFDQMDMSPQLLSRFDAIFPMLDVISEEHDADLANHILSTHQSMEAGMGGSNKAILPVIDNELFRKYIGYAKMNCSPVMTNECMDYIRKYYVSIRNINKGRGNNGVPMTPRQLEALIRMSEAGAKARLSKTVDVNDAHRAKGIMEHYLKQVASEGGMFDIDAIMTGSTKSQRDRIDVIKMIVKEKGELSEEELLQECVNKGIAVSKAQRDIQRLIDNGTMFRPTNETIKLMRGLY